MKEKNKKDGRDLRIIQITICKYLKAYYGATRKEKKLFYIKSKKNRKKNQILPKVF